MAVIGACASSLSPIHRRDVTSWRFGRQHRTSPILPRATWRLAVVCRDRLSVTEAVTTRSETASSSLSLRKTREEKDGEKAAEMTANPYANPEEARDECRKNLADCFEEVRDLIRSNGGDCGPPRWFSPLECGARARDSPLLLYLPGIDGTGLGLTRHHRKLGKIFDIWCLHIPVMDRTPAGELVKFVERTVRSETYRYPYRPIYIVGESLGACLALEVAARNPDVDLLLILANPATSISRSMLQPLLSLLEIIPDQLLSPIQDKISLNEGDPLKLIMEIIAKGLPRQRITGELTVDLVAVLSHLHILGDTLPKETLLWKLQMLKSASSSANSHLHAVRAQTLLIASGRDQLLPSVQEAERIRRILLKCETHRCNENGHFLFLEGDFDLVTIIKAASIYRRGKYHDYVSDFVPPTPFEFRKIYEANRLIPYTTSPVTLSTLDDSKVVKGLGGIPSEGPALYVGYHMLLGLELSPLVIKFLTERNILLRGMAHPMMFERLREGKLPELQSFGTYRLMGAVPVQAGNFYKLLSSNSHVLLYPGGMREALHRKGEEYKLFWPENAEFVRMAARFGAKIIPFGVVGEDDIGELVFDYEDQMKIPYLKNFIEEMSSEVQTLRINEKGAVGNQDVHLPGVLPKLPGRFYYYFAKPIETAGRKQELRDRVKAHELYLEVQSEVERCIAYLKEKRESDPYRSLLSRLLYYASHGFGSEVPTFEL